MKFLLTLLGSISMLCACIHESAALEIITKTIEPQYFGMHIHRADSETPWPGKNIGAWRLHDANVTWALLQPEKNHWEFERLDRYVAIAKITGVELLLPLGFTPRWAALRWNENSAYGLGAASEPRDIEDWRNYVRTIVQRYKGKIKAYEMWNEPNLVNFYSGTPEILAGLQKETYAIIKSIDPEAKLVSASATEDSPKALEWFRHYIELGGASYADVIGYHFYLATSEPENVINLASKLHVILNRAGVKKPLWNTESGWRIENQNHMSISESFDLGWKLLEERQAASYVVRSLLLARFADIERYYWYAWDNAEMGLMESVTNKPKLAGRVYLRLAERLTGGRMLNCQQEKILWQCTLVDRDGRNMTALWTSDNQQIVITPKLEWGNLLWRPLDETNETILPDRRITITSEPVVFYK
jgi:hypothetical protein